jgi:hypothetical protein
MFLLYRKPVSSREDVFITTDGEMRESQQLK